MKMKTNLGLGLLIMLVITSGFATAAAQTMETTDTEVQFILGLFPREQGDSISFMSLTPPGSMTILSEDFRGHIGVLIIVGFHNPAPM